MKTKSGFGLGLPETQAAVAFLPLAAGLKQVYALETLENVALGCDFAGAFQAAMLTHFCFSLLETWIDSISQPPREGKGAKMEIVMDIGAHRADSSTV